MMVAAAMSPDHSWRQPVPRAVDTVVGVVVGFVGAWINLMAVNGVRRTSSAVESLERLGKDDLP